MWYGGTPAGYNAYVRYLFLTLAVLTLAGCGLIGGSLEDRAADYYNFMVGNTPNVKYSSFISPAYRGVFTREALKEYNDKMGRGDKVLGRHGEATAADVTVRQNDKFAITVIDPETGRAFANLEPARWVKAGSKWYLYFGSDAEISRYGPFPEGLQPPAVRRQEPEPAEPVDGVEEGTK